MTIIAVQPIVLKDVELIIETDDYSHHVSSVTFTPTAGTTTWKGLSPDAVFSDSQVATWTCTLEYAQDWTTANSLAGYLFDNAGQTKACTFQPKKGTGLPEFSADVILASGPIGGKIDEVMTASVTLGVDGKPERGVAA